MRRGTRCLAVAAAAALALTGCGLQRGGMSSSGVPNRTEVVVHTGPGGGSDVFARQVVKLMQQDDLIKDNWPVRNQPEGSGIGAMSYLIGRKGRVDSIAAVTPTWLVTPLTLDGASVSVDETQPIAGVLTEPQLLAVPAKSPYHDAKDLIAAAKKQPDKLVQVGGSVTATDSLTGKALQARTGTKWKYLTFSDSGQRIAALLRGDAQLMIGATNDFSEQVKAGHIRVIAVVATQRVAAFPQVPTLKEQGFDTSGLPEEFRGFVGPPDMPKKALAYYQKEFGKLVKTKRWKDYARQNGDITRFLDAPQFEKLIEAQQKQLKKLVDELGLVQK
ncbi:Bug family tripartite tricarboxylate transporter substrate binding protein [Streptomyces sp. NPDC050560]|uniref:Bug family tripartite tricarboxylate transporter substrate binding protein n=1 Tax=Streptomyces sp. NPDC050560 TaxID=3365630 RepID=UPI0037AB576A